MINSFPGFIMIGLQSFFSIFCFFFVKRVPDPAINFVEMGGFTGVIIFKCLFLLSTVTIILSQKIHEEMTQKERAMTFPEYTDEIPDYELVPIYWPSVQKRDVQRGSAVELKAFGRHIKLWLNPVEGVLAGLDMPIYNVRSGPNGPIIGQYNHPLQLIAVRMYEDLSKATTLAVNPGGGGRKRITGVVNSEKITVRPMPPRLVNRVTRRQRSIDGDHLSEDHHYHIVYKTPDANIAEPVRSTREVRDRKGRVPDVVYPEILIVVEYDLYMKFAKSVWELVPYLLGFWNGVDMRYRSLEHPKFRLNIAGIVVPEDPDAFDFITKYRYNNETLQGYPLLLDFGEWLRKYENRIPLLSYDVAAIMTLSMMCWKRANGECEGNVLGMGFPSGICTGNQPSETVYKTMILQDHAGFDGIYVAIHELGHILGAYHDTGDENSTCPHEHGHIMTASPRSGINSTLWSSCSLANFTELINSEPECIYNKPVQGVRLPRYLPGRIMDANEQCRILMGTKAYRIDSSICLRLTCILPDRPNDYEYIGSPAADGTSCGRGRICIYGRCITERYITW